MDPSIHPSGGTAARDRRVPPRGAAPGARSTSHDMTALPLHCCCCFQVPCCMHTLLFISAPKQSTRGEALAAAWRRGGHLPSPSSVPHTCHARLHSSPARAPATAGQCSGARRRPISAHGRQAAHRGRPGRATARVRPCLPTCPPVEAADERRRRHRLLTSSYLLFSPLSPLHSLLSSSDCRTSAPCAPRTAAGMCAVSCATINAAVLAAPAEG